MEGSGQHGEAILNSTGTCRWTVCPLDASEDTTMKGAATLAPKENEPILCCRLSLWDLSLLMSLPMWSGPCTHIHLQHTR